MNTCILIGRITRDPVLGQMSNTSVVQFTLAVNRDYADKNGDRQVDFINCVAWRGQADFIGKYIKKGYLMSIEGRIQTNSYADKQGQTRYSTQVVCEKVYNLEPRKQEQQAQPQQQPQVAQQQMNMNGGSFIPDEMLPF